MTATTILPEIDGWCAAVALEERFFPLVVLSINHALDVGLQPVLYKILS